MKLRIRTKKKSSRVKRGLNRETGIRSYKRARRLEKLTPDLRGKGSLPRKRGTGRKRPMPPVLAPELAVAKETAPPAAPVNRGERSMIVCTVTSASNLHRAKVMARSIKEHEPHARVVVCLVEKYIHPLADFPYFDEVVLANDLGVPNLPKMMFKYTVSEGTTAMKPYLVQYAMRRYADEHVFLYLDTDMRVYHPLEELFERLEQYSILITPHVLDQKGHDDGYLLAGVYNSGLLAFTRSEETERFLAWWGNQLYHYCYFDDKYFADQTWLDFAPVYFNAHIWRHPGYNMAAWNLIERNFTRIENGFHYVNDRPLCIFHYSGLWGLLQNNINRCYPDSSNPMYGLLAAYEQELEEMGRSEAKDIFWSYDFFSSGEFIERAVKRKYKEDPDKYQNMTDPFSESNSDF